MNVHGILAAARDEGIIQFRIKNSISECVSLQSQLVAKFGFAEAIVVPSATDWRMAHVVIGHVVGEYLSNRISPRDVIAIGWGRTISAAISRFPQRAVPRTAVVSLLGGLTHLAPLDPAGVATDLAGRINAECYVLPVPVFADEPEHRDLFMGQNSIQEAMRWARRASVGQEDHLSKLVEARGFLEFWRLNMRPGKPVGLGDIDDCPILVLPGNPMAAAVAFKFLGEVLIGCLSGDTVNYPKTMTLQLSAPYQTKFDRLEIFAARLINSPEGSVSIEILLHQGSANLVALATGEGLVVLEPNIFDRGRYVPLGAT